MNKQVAKATENKQSVAVSTSADPFASFAGAGMEDVEASDILIPRISVLQALSPQLNAQKSQFIEGSKPGMICDVGTGELLGDGITFLPLHYAKQWIEWFPRKSGKGLAAIHDNPSILDRCTLNEKRQPFLSNGNYIQETAQFYGLNLSAEGRMCFIPMASTQLKVARKWLTLATSERAVDSSGNSFQPPLFYRAYELGVTNETNAEGDWYGWSVARGPLLTAIEGWEDMFKRVVQLRDQIKQGQAKADLSQDDSGVVIDHEHGAM